MMSLLLAFWVSLSFASEDFTIQSPEKVNCHVMRALPRGGMEVVQTVAFRKQDDGVYALFSEAISSKWFGKIHTSVSQGLVSSSVKGSTLVVSSSLDEEREDHRFEFKIPLQLPRYNYQIPLNAEFKSWTVMGQKKFKQLKISCGVTY